MNGDELAVFNEVWALNMGKRFRPYVAICQQNGGSSDLETTKVYYTDIELFGFKTSESNEDQVIFTNHIT